MDRDRWIQLFAIALALLCLASASTLIPPIIHQRTDLQLTRQTDIGEEVPAKYALTAAALGPFRGIVIDVAWWRADRLKREGKLFEANTLAQWITTLQPRFPRVWSFHAWNLAFNISVLTHTPEERYAWVLKGINLLRNEGIPYNPEATTLYRELAWIYFFKMSQFTDDMNWYYKRMHAEEWELLLGAPTDGATTEQAIAEFKPIADAADAYFPGRIGRATLDAQEMIRNVIERHPDATPFLDPLIHENPAKLLRELQGLHERFTENQNVVAVRAIEPIREKIHEQLQRAGVPAEQLLYERVPEARQVVQRLQEAGFQLDKEALNRIGELLMFARYRSFEWLHDALVDQIDARDRRLLKILEDPQIAEPLSQVITFLRAKVLLEDYHMDPGVMYELMTLFGPIDWRHPAAHAVYWSFVGVRRSGQLVDSNRIELLNTDRQMIHGVQQLMFFGKVNFDPFIGTVDMIPDPRFIPSYDRAKDLALERLTGSGIFAEGETRDDFMYGHENFLLDATVYTYLYGDREQAQKYLEKARRLYSHKPQNVNSPRYLLPLEDLVIHELQNQNIRFSYTRQFVDSMIENAIRQGLANGRMELFERFTRIAQKAHAKSQQEKLSADAVNPEAPGSSRLAMQDFREVLAVTYSELMENPAVPLLMRQKIYANTPAELRLASYSQWREPVFRQAHAAGFDPAAAFPPPPGYQQLLEQTPDESVAPGKPTTVERR